MIYESTKAKSALMMMREPEYCNFAAVMTEKDFEFQLQHCGLGCCHVYSIIISA
jgi:hypothetical protein